MKYKTINGWTKAKMLEVIRARPFDEPAENGTSCAYLTADGNKCGVGLFLSDGHEAQDANMGVGHLLCYYSDLRRTMPLDADGLSALQTSHDSESKWGTHGKIDFAGNAKAAMLHFVETEVYDE